MKKEYNSYKTDYRVNSVSTVNKKTSYYGVNTSVENSRQSKDNNRYFSKVVERANKWDSNYDVFKKNKKLTRETESTNYYNRKKLLNEKEDYRRQILLERIKEHDNKTQSLEKQRTGLIKLRQEMRKNAAFAKYQAKQELEKLAVKCKSQEYDENIVGKMLEAAGLENIPVFNTKQSSKNIEDVDVYSNLRSINNNLPYP